jgi:hypothetical protein
MTDLLLVLALVFPGIWAYVACGGSAATATTP